MYNIHRCVIHCINFHQPWQCQTDNWLVLRDSRLGMRLNYKCRSVGASRLDVKGMDSSMASPCKYHRICILYISLTLHTIVHVYIYIHIYIQYILLVLIHDDHMYTSASVSVHRFETHRSVDSEACFAKGQWTCAWWTDHILLQCIFYRCPTPARLEPTEIW